MKFLKDVVKVAILLLSITLVFEKQAAAETPSDKDISNAVDNELLYNATTPAYLIDVTTNEGIVTLSGSVNNILSKDRAVKIARTLKGVRGVVDNIKVDAPFVADNILKSNVEKALLNDPATDSYEITVNSDNGEVTLKGRVDSWQEKQLSEFVTKGVSGVKKVDNNLIVNYRTQRPDYEIKEDIQQSLKNDVRIDDGLVNVSVKNGKVKLSGVVGSANEKSLAYFQAWSAGVNAVNDKDLKVEGWARDDNLRKNKYVTKSDDEITNAVKDAFLYDPRVFSFNPDISVRDGVVYLNGVVDNLKAKQSAEQDAKNVVGVLRVKNYLKVRPVSIPDNDDLKAKIESEILMDPVLKLWKIDVKANNGIVYLNGAVDSYFEKTKAEDLVSKTKGVINVENNLSVYDNNDYFFYNNYGWNTYYPPYLVDVKPAYRSDEAIKENIIEELWWSPYVNQEEVTVVVKDGKAILSGTVDTKREKLFAEINALEGGAMKVENNLKVEYTQ